MGEGKTSPFFCRKKKLARFARFAIYGQALRAYLSLLKHYGARFARPI